MSDTRRAVLMLIYYHSIYFTGNLITETISFSLSASRRTCCILIVIFAYKTNNVTEVITSAYNKEQMHKVASPFLFSQSITLLYKH